MSDLSRLTRRSALKSLAAATLAVPAIRRLHATAPSETLYHASVGASGMGGADLSSLTASPHLKLVAVADVDLRRTADAKQRFPGIKVYQDWRELLDKEKHLDSINVSTPDHMHGSVTMRALQRGLNVYCQKPLTQTIFEARQVTLVAREKKLVTQMGIQIHSHPVHKQVVAIIEDGAIGKVKEVHSWSGKQWGDRSRRPDRNDPVPEGFNWDLWLGVAARRPFIRGYYHPGEWRKRLDFGTGTFGDMGCHILDPVFTSLALTSPRTVTSVGGAPNQHNWGLDSEVTYVFPQTKYSTETMTLHWYDGDLRPPVAVRNLIGKRSLSDQGSIYIGTKGVLYSPYIDSPVLLPDEQYKDYKRPEPQGDDHYIQFVEACRGNGKTSAPFDYAGLLTESVLFGCLATRFPKQPLEFDTAALKITNSAEANRFVKRTFRAGWETKGLS